MLKTAQRNSTPVSTETLDDYGLGNVNCPKCGNKGYVYETKDGISRAWPCSCMKQRRSLRALKNSGMADMMTRYSFSTYLTDTQERLQVRKNAQHYAEAGEGWYFIYGQSGSGKTHICASICNELFERGAELKYITWRDEATRLKSIINTDEYSREMQKLKTVMVLYIDDLFKGKVTEADINLAFELLNARYNDSELRTIISSEFSLGEIMELDEAIGGRIYERARDYTVKAPKENWRLK